MGSSTHSATLPGQLQCFNAVPFSFVSMNCDTVLLSPFLSHQLRYSILVGIGKFEHYQQRAVWSLWSPYTYILMKAYWYYGVGRGGWGWGGKIDSLFLSSWIIPNRFWSKNKKYWLANSSFRLSHSLKEFFWIAKVNVVINMIFSNSP